MAPGRGRRAGAPCGRILQVVLLLVALGGPVLAPGSELGSATWVQRTFRATGRWDGGALLAESMQLRDAFDTADRLQLSGRISRIDARSKRFSLGPWRVQWSDATRFERLSGVSITEGRSLRVSGRLQQGVLLASSVRAAEDAGAATLQLTALVTAAAERADGGFEFSMGGQPVRTARAGYNAVESLTRRQDARRPQALFEDELLGGPLAISGEFAMQLRDRRNYALERTRDQILDSESEFQLDAYWAPRERLHLFAGAKLLYDAELLRGGGTRAPQAAVERDQAWVFFDRIGGSNLGLQVGRQNFKETREWWWDDDLDAARLYFDRAGWHAEVAIARELAKVSSLDDGIDPEQDGVFRTLATASWLWAPRQRLEAYFLRADDRSGGQRIGTRIDATREDRSDARLTWYGLRALGSRTAGRFGTLEYWVDWAAVSGDEDLARYVQAGDTLTVTQSRRVTVRGSAYDLGLTWETPLPGTPSLTLGHAAGSGDGDGDDGIDHAFRQTGLHNNKWRYNGVNRFRFYGELLRPELSNLSVTTASLGLPLLRNSSVELAWHRYRQRVARDSLRGSRLDVDPDGVSPDIGEELDLVLGFREGQRLDIELVAGLFDAGQAFAGAGRRRALFGQVEFTWNF